MNAPANPPMRGLNTAAVGLLIVFVDFRIGGIDLILDPLGWYLAAVSFSPLGRLHRGFGVASVTSALALLPAIPDFLGSTHPVVSFVGALAQVVVVVAGCTALMSLTPSRATSASWIRSLTVGFGVALLVLIPAATASPDLTAVVFLVGFLDLLVFVWFLVVLGGAARCEPVTPSVP